MEFYSSTAERSRCVIDHHSARAAGQKRDGRCLRFSEKCQTHAGGGGQGVPFKINITPQRLSEGINAPLQNRFMTHRHVFLTAWFTVETAPRKTFFCSFTSSSFIPIRPSNPPSGTVRPSAFHRDEDGDMTGGTSTVVCKHESRLLTVAANAWPTF